MINFLLTVYMSGFGLTLGVTWIGAWLSGDRIPKDLYWVFVNSFLWFIFWPLVLKEKWNERERNARRPR
jgi:hypothetical protein